jgi:hypothetical protein
MRQPQEPDGFHDEDLERYDGDDEDEDLEELGTPVYQGSGLSVRALAAEELQRFLDAHDGQPAELLGSGWREAAVSPPPDAARLGEVGSSDLVPAARGVPPARPVSGSLGSPGRSALAAARRQRSEELAAWTRSLAWRAPLVAAAGLAVQVLATQAGLPHGSLVGLVAAVLVGWRLRFRPSEQVRLAARRPGRAPHRPPAGPAHPGRLRGVPRPRRARLTRQHGLR